MTRLVFLAALVLCVLLWPAPGRAQPAGYYATPSLTLSGIFDDNVFITSAHREADFILRTTPGISGGYRSAPLTILGSFSFDIEKYAVNEDLDNVADRQLGTLDMRYLPDQRLTLALTAVYAKTNRPTELSRQQGLQPIARIERGLVETTALSVSPSATYRLTALMSATGSYSYSLLEPESGGSTTQHVVNLGLTRRFTGKDTGSLKYIGRRFEFENEPDTTTTSTTSTGTTNTGTTTQTSHAIVAGWIRRLTQFTTVTLEAGPRFTEGQIGPEVLATVDHRLRSGNLLLSYARTEAITVGQSGTVSIDTLTAQASFRPIQFLQVSGGPSVQRATSEARSGSSGETTTIYYYSLGASATYQINKWLNARAGYAWSLQDASGGPQILHNLFSISLIAAYPTRIDY